MDEKDILRAQVQALINQLDWAENSLTALEIEPAALREAMHNRFVILFNERRVELNKLREQAVGGRNPAVSWDTFNRYQKACDELFRECLSYLGGILLRKDKLDKNINEMADALLKDISGKTTIKWERLTILAAEGNFFTETTEVIRLPYPDFSIWNLPVAAHELGHFIGPRLHDSLGDNPFQDKLKQGSTSSSNKSAAESENAAKVDLQNPSYLHEFFADLFAIYTTGPAYACCCFITRFSPSKKSFCEDGQTHPSDAKRAQFMLMALEELDKNRQPSFSGVIRFLEDLWGRNLKIAGKAGCLDTSYLPELRLKVLLALNPIVSKYALPARYPEASWSRAKNLAQELLSATPAEQLIKADDAIIDVLNAAWAWRIQQPQEVRLDVEQVERKSMEICRLIARRGKQN